jgi:regulator of cell morphogenesis and NO signaling
MEALKLQNLIFNYPETEVAPGVKSIRPDLKKEFFDQENEILHNIPDFGFSTYKWPLDILIEFIIQNHHYYTSEKTDEIKNLLSRLQSENNEVEFLVSSFKECFKKLSEHLQLLNQLEEEILFPAIKCLLSTGITPEIPPYKTLQNAIKEFKEDHAEIYYGLSVIRNISDNIKFSGIISPTLKRLNQLFRDFEYNLYVHFHLENNLLFPEAIFLEEESYIWE